jgi:class 3 adenylate cyclase/acyl-coenzyme A thioesterase PaaI-like protein
VIPDEPVRGRNQPPWFRALSGIERIRAFSRSLVPSPPIVHLLGHRATHVAAGTATFVMPASDACISPNGQLEIVPAAIVALEGASLTALPGGMDVVPMRFTFKAFRPAWPGKGNILARARVVNDGHLFVFAEVQVEDPDGRYLGQGSLHSMIQPVEPPPPPPPATLTRIEDPVYETPNPYLRRLPSGPFVDLLEREDGLTVLRKVADGRLATPAMLTWGLQVHDLEQGHIRQSMPASEWFCGLGTNVSCQAIGTFTDFCGWCAALSLQRAGTAVILLDSDTRFLRPVPPDGRRIRAESSVSEPAPDLFVIETKVNDPDGRLIALGTCGVARIDAARRIGRQRRESQRVLTTLLFTDIVDSTGHAQRLGDTAWRALLEQHHVTTRREVARCNGAEVATTGDGFLARFDSPAQAIEAACAVRRAVERLGLQIRAGVHSGECEVAGTTLAGMAIHIASRIQAAAAPGEVLVSSTVKALVVGSALRFVDRGEQMLKGVPEPWRLYAVTE